MWAGCSGSVLDMTINLRSDNPILLPLQYRDLRRYHALVSKWYI